MKWSSTLTASIALLAMLVGPSLVEAKVSLKRKPASQNVTLDEIELDEDEPPKDEKPKQEPEVDPVSPKVAEAIKKASVFEEKKSFENVVKTLKPFVSQLPRHGSLLLSRAYRETKNYQGELQMLQILLAKNEKDYVVKTQEADALMRLDRAEEAAIAYRVARDLNKHYRPAYEGHWMALEKTRDLYEAGGALSDMINIFGPTPKSQGELCRLFSMQNFLLRTEENCKKAIELDPKNQDNYIHLGMSLRDQEHIDDAVKLMLDATKRFPASERILTSAAELNANKKDFASSYDLYKKATALNANSMGSWLGLAKSAQELQKYSEALGAFQKACAMDRKNSIQVRNAAMELKKNGKEKLAQTYFDAAFDCDNTILIDAKPPMPPMLPQKGP